MSNRVKAVTRLMTYRELFEERLKPNRDRLLQHRLSTYKDELPADYADKFNAATLMARTTFDPDFVMRVTIRYVVINGSTATLLQYKVNDRLNPYGVKK